MRRKPKSAGRAPPRHHASHSAAATKQRSKTMSEMMVVAGLGLLTVEPPALPTTSTMIVPSDPSTRPRATAAGAVHTGHGARSSGPVGPGSGAGGSSADATAGREGVGDMTILRLRPVEL